MTDLLQKILGVGKQAQSVLSSEAYRLAVEGLHTDLVNELVATKPTEAEKRESLYISIRMLADINERLRVMVETAEHELRKQQEANQGQLKQGDVI